MKLSIKKGIFNRAITTALLLAVAALFLTQAQFAFAHSRFKSANIQPDAVLTNPPATLTITFSEETSPTQTKLQVLDSTGKAVDKGDVKVSGATVSVSLPALADGKYNVTFRTLTEDDGGIINGGYSFTVAKGGTAVTGDVAKVTQAESSTQPSNAPATGQGGLAGASENWSLYLVMAFGGISILAAGFLLIKSKRWARK